MFNVICLETGEPVSAAEGLGPLQFDNGQEAAVYARALTVGLGKKHQPRPCKDTAWAAREAQRFADGTYTRLPWDMSQHGDYNEWHWFTKFRKPEALLHFPHVSKTHPGCIAFTQDEAKGAANIQTPMKPGRYLKQFYLLSIDKYSGEGLTDNDVRTFANEFLSKYGTMQLKFAHTPDEIEHVYLKGPNSCMSKEARRFDSSVHPTRVYGAGDLAIAYLVNSDDNEEHITARVLCWPAKKVYGLVYGDEDKIGALLDAQGYSNTDDMSGAKLLRIEDDNGRIVCPYIDGDYKSVQDHGTYLRIGGDLDAEQQDGYCGEAGEYCSSCDSRGHDESDMTYIDDAGENVCQSCLDNNYWCCEHSGNYYSSNATAVEMSDGVLWCQDAFESNGFHCDATGTNYATHGNDYVVLSGSCEGECWHTDHFASNGFTCEDCNEHFSDDDKHDITDADCGENVCLDCAGKAGLKQLELELETVSS